MQLFAVTGGLGVYRAFVSSGLSKPLHCKSGGILIGRALSCSAGKALRQMTHCRSPMLLLVSGASRLYPDHNVHCS